jgi:hypothetical protein
VTRYRRLNLPGAGAEENDQADDEQSPAAEMLPPVTVGVPKEKTSGEEECREIQAFCR